MTQLERVDEDAIRSMVDDAFVQAHRNRALNPDHPVLTGSTQNLDVYFQGREAANPFYNTCAEKVQHALDRLARITGRTYRLFDYFGADDSRLPSIPLSHYWAKEARYGALLSNTPEIASDVLKLAQSDVDMRWKLYECLAKVAYRKADYV